jgi:Na+/H+ antiporter NhaC
LSQQESKKDITARAETSAYGKKIERLNFWVGSFGSAIPMIVFIVWAIAICLSMAEQGAPDESGLILGAVVGLVVGMFFCKSSWADYSQAVFDGMSSPVGVIAIVCWIWAGIFAKVLAAGGLVNGLVWLGGVTGFSGSMFVVITFILAAVFATAVGTGYGTTIAFCELLYPAGIVLGADPVVLFAAILSGAAFGDNLAPVSDTTIISAVTQETDVPGVVRSRFKYAIIAAIPAAILFFIFGDGGAVDLSQATDLIGQYSDPAGLILLIPFVLVVFLALSGRHIMVSITWGIVVAVVLIVLSNLEFLSGLFGKPLAQVSALLYVDNEKLAVTGALADGINGFLKMGILILFIVTSGHIMAVGGGLDSIKRAILRLVRGTVWRVELAMFSAVATLNVFITVNTAAEIAAAPFVTDLGKEFGIHPYRRANFLDAVSSAFGYIFPWSGGVLIGVATLRTLSERFDFVGSISPMDVWPFVFHGWLLALVMLTAALTGFGRRYVGLEGEPAKVPPR